MNRLTRGPVTVSGIVCQDRGSLYSSRRRTLLFAIKFIGILTCTFSNLTYELSERKLEEVFIMAGEIRDLRIPKKGHAIIEYHKTTDALRSVP